jgi:hypothetical protein
MSGGAPRFCSTAPVQEPPSPLPSDFDLGPPLCGGRCRAEVRWERRCNGIFPTVILGRSGEVEEAAVMKKRWPSSERARWECVRRAAIATRGKAGPMSGGAPRFCSTAPVQEPPSPLPSDFDLGRPEPEKSPKCTFVIISCDC